MDLQVFNFFFQTLCFLKVSLTTFLFLFSFYKICYGPVFSLQMTITLWVLNHEIAEKWVKTAQSLVLSFKNEAL